jgi:ATP synthase protein I
MSARKMETARRDMVIPYFLRWRIGVGSTSRVNSLADLGFLDSPLPAAYGPRAFAGGVGRQLRVGMGARDDRGDPSAEEAALSARLERLGERLGQLRTPKSSETRSNADASANATAFARGFRLSAELIGAVLFGAAIGWLLDRWLGISPWGMIVFLLLGFAAGVLNVVRSANVVPPDRLDGPGR